MFIVLTKYKADLAKVDLKRGEHVQYLKKLEKEKKLLVGGRQTPPTGGLLIFTIKSKVELVKILEEDPYAIAGLSDCEIFEFTPGVYADILKEFI